MHDDDHPAAAEPMNARVAYARLVASLAAADDEITPHEQEQLRQLCRLLALPPHVAQEVLQFAEKPNAAALRGALEGLRDSQLRFTLIADMIGLAYADGKYDLSERKQIRGIAAILLIGEDEVIQLEDRIRTDVRSEAETTHDDDQGHKQSIDTMAQLVAAGVPAAAVYTLGATKATGAAAVTAGLTTLSLGSGVMPGLGVAVGLGVGSYLGVHWLYRRLSAES